MSATFVTGGTGAVGSAVIARILADPSARVVALVRGTAVDEARQRLLRAIDRPLGPSRAVDWTERVDVRLGDARLPRFALDDAAYEALARTCTHVIHCAGAVRMNLPLDEARAAAVGSARAIVALATRLAQAGRLRKVEFVSTVGVAGRAHRLLAERWVGTDHAFHNTYEQAKAEAESEVRAAIEAGLPVTVHRPSMVVGDSLTGHATHFQVFYHLAEFLSGRRTAGLFPRLGQARLDVVPVDFVAEAIVRSGASTATAARVLHLCAGPQRAILLADLQSQVRALLAARGTRVPPAIRVPRSWFRLLVRGVAPIVDAKSRAALRALPVLLDYLDTEQAFDDAETARWLAEEGIAAPDPQAYLPRILAFYFDSRSIP